MRHQLRNLGCALLVVAAVGCSDDGVSDEEGARIAYLGIDPAVDKMLDLGFKGRSEASSAHIPEQSTTGDVSGTMTVGGKVDAGNTKNDEMDLTVVLVGYSDGAVASEGIDDIVYDSEGPLNLGASLKGLPDGTLNGTLSGTVFMHGGLEGAVSLSLSFAGETEDDGAGTARRKAGTVRVTGTATSDYGVFTVDVIH